MLEEVKANVTLIRTRTSTEWDEEKHDIDEVFAFLCYRGVNYAKWVFIGDIFEQNWMMKNPREEG